MDQWRQEHENLYEDSYKLTLLGYDHKDITFEGLEVCALGK
jgi:hypothetical protein